MLCFWPVRPQIDPRPVQKLELMPTVLQKSVVLGVGAKQLNWCLPSWDVFFLERFMHFLVRYTVYCTICLYQSRTLARNKKYKKSSGLFFQVMKLFDEIIKVIILLHNQCRNTLYSGGTILGVKRIKERGKPETDRYVKKCINRLDCWNTGPGFESGISQRSAREPCAIL